MILNLTTIIKYNKNIVGYINKIWKNYFKANIMAQQLIWDDQIYKSTYVCTRASF